MGHNTLYVRPQIVCCTILTCLASWLLQPVSMSTGDDLLMQVWVVKPCMSDPIWLCVTLGHTLYVRPYLAV